MMKKILAGLMICTLGGFAGLACASYSTHNDDEDLCEGVSCLSPPEPVCVDETTVGIYRSPGSCSQGECTYALDEIVCRQGSCLNGKCDGCTPNCTLRECGPDPDCGSSCGDCIGCEGLPDPGLCDRAGFCMHVCCPDCTGMECGPDPVCGEICGTCEPGCSCSQGMCECGCVYPNYPPDCSQVDYFQCGFDGYCDDGEIFVSWHEHVMCNGEEDIVEFECSFVCPHGCTEGSVDWADDGQQLVEQNCRLLGGCEDILIDNQGPPGIYPFQYLAPADAAGQFQDNWAGFLSANNVSEDSYSAEPHPITWTPDIERDYMAGAWIVVSDQVVTEENIESIARSFLAEYAGLFRTESIALNLRSSGCPSIRCRAIFDQDYCGLGVVSDVPDYDGVFRFFVDEESGGLVIADSRVVPMIPVARNPSHTEEQVIQSLVGTTMEYWCADGPHYAVINDNSSFTFAEDPVVFVRPALTTGVEFLEYRLAYQLTVMADSHLTWTLHVDGFDGTLLKLEPDFICD